MKVLIIENEIYLAQSIATKLGHLGFECETATFADESLFVKEYDVVLLSTNLIEQNIYPIISVYKDSIIILMISYISDDTVTKPMKAGAKDYILKPFMIDELVRKIQHYHTFQHLKQTVAFYRNYVDMTLDNFVTEVPNKISLPLVLQSQNQKSIDAYVIFYARRNECSLSFLSLKRHRNWKEILRQSQRNNYILYVVGCEELKKAERREFLEILIDKQAIASFIGSEPISFHNVVEIGGVNNIDFYGEFLCVDDYIKNVILRYEHKYPDTELSRRLGMSRKSLWEKRKKYGIIKKK